MLCFRLMGVFRQTEAAIFKSVYINVMELLSMIFWNFKARLGCSAVSVVVRRPLARAFLIFLLILSWGKSEHRIEIIAVSHSHLICNILNFCVLSGANNICRAVYKEL